MNKAIILCCFIAVLPLCVFAQDDELARAKKELEESKARVAKLEELARVKKELEETKAHISKLETQISQPNIAAPDADIPADEIINVHISVENPEIPQSKSPVPVLAQTQEQGNEKYFVFSIRYGGILTGTKAKGIGTAIELGRISESGFYFSTAFNGGAHWGGGFNFGGCINKDRTVKNVFGITAGFWDAPVKVNLVRKIWGTDITGGGMGRYWDHNYNFGGVVYKLMFGRKGNFDITNKLFLSMRKLCREYDNSIGDMIYERSFSYTYSCEYGFTLTKKKVKGE